MKRSPFEADHPRAADVARDLNVPPIVATHYGVPCPVCGLVVGTLANGRIRQHYVSSLMTMCAGSYNVPATTREAPPFP